jgi:hypothetical protein
VIPRTTGGTAGESSIGSPALLWHRGALALLALLLALLGAASLWWPFSWDHGVFGWIGDTIVRGGMPYRDAWDVKGPLTFYVFAAVDRLVDKAMWGIRVFDLVMLGLGMAAAGRMVRSLGGPGAGPYAALALALQYAGTGYFETAQPDGWAAILLLLALAPLIRDERRTSVRAAVLSGLLIGTAVLLKPPYAALLVAPGLYLVLGQDRQAPARVRALLLLGLAFLLPAALCAAWFAWRGALDSLIDTYILFNLRQSAIPPPGLDISLAGTIRRFGRRVLTNPPVVLAGVAAAIALVEMRRDRRRAAVILAAATAAAFFIVGIQQRYWNRYQWHVAYMPLMVLAGIGLGRLWHGAPAERSRMPFRVAAVTLGGLLLLFLLPKPLAEVRRWVDLMTGRVGRAEYEAAFAHPALSWTITDSRAIAGFVQAHTTPEETVFVWSDPLVHYLTGRSTTGRLAFHVPLTTLETSYQRRYRDELMRDLSRRPPRYLAVARRSLDGADSLNEANIAHRLPELHAKLIAEYSPVARFGGMDVYQRRETPVPRR